MLWPWSSPAPLICLRGPRVVLRLPQMGDYEAWYALRHSSRDFLRPFEPRWTDADLGRRVFATRVRRAREEALDLHRVHAAFLPGNTASRRVLEKNGFAEEGFAEKYLQINGRWEDHVLFGLTRERYDMARYLRRV